jgi:uncharacterized protein (DUF983 family)
MERKETTMFVTTKVEHIEYRCPYCNELISYDTDLMPTKEQCHKCLHDLESIKIFYV